MLNGGGVYIHGRDKNLRPIIICNIQKLIQQKHLFGENNKDLINLVIYLLEYMEKFMLIPGRIENFILIIDC